MLVKTKPVAGGTYALLFDESAGDGNEKFAPSFTDTVFFPGGYGAASAPKVPMNGTRGRIPFKWHQNYATQDAAAASIATLRTAFKGVPVHIQVTVGATILYFPNANLSASSHDQFGREMTHELTFETDDITTIAP